MTIARITGEAWDAPRLDVDFQSQIDREFLARVPRGRKYLAIYRLRVVWNWSGREIAESVERNPGHCSRIFRQTQQRLEAIRKEQFTAVSPMLESDDRSEFNQVDA